MGWQWHQLDHMQIICTLFQTDNQASTSSLNFLQVECSCWCPTKSVKVVKAKVGTYNHRQKVIKRYAFSSLTCALIKNAAFVYAAFLSGPARDGPPTQNHLDNCSRYFTRWMPFLSLLQPQKKKDITHLLWATHDVSDAIYFTLAVWCQYYQTQK